MYSRHSGINIPKNYNGVRFRNSPENTNMKEHRPIYRQEIKTAHSPLYDSTDMKAPTDEGLTEQNLLSENNDTEKAANTEMDDECCSYTDCEEYNDEEVYNDDGWVIERSESDDCPKKNDCPIGDLSSTVFNSNTEGAVTDTKKPIKAENSLLNALKVPISDIFKSINREDALLLGLILLLSSEQKEDNSLILTFLALILLKR